MAGPPGRLRAFLRSEHGRRLLKFGTVSVISTCVTQLVLLLSYDVVSLGTAIECNVLATAVATVPAYWLNRNWTWGKRGRSNPWRELVPFWGISFIGLVLSTIAVGLAAHNASAISHSHFIRRAFVSFANLFTYGLIWVGRYAVFNKFLFGHATYETPDGLAVPGEVEAIVVEEHHQHEESTPALEAVGEIEGVS